jgi:phosphate transport system substrate-binding protein
MNRATWLSALGLVLAGVAGCQRGARDTPHLVLTGSREMVPLVKEIARRFEVERPDVRIDVQARTPALAVVDVRQGLADIGLVARGLRADEASLAATPLAYDGVALIVHKSNPVQALTDEQVTGLYLRAYTNWKQVGGIDRRVTLVGLAEGSALHEVFAEHYGLRTTPVRPDQIVVTSSLALQAVAQRPSAIGYASLAETTGRPTLAVRLLPMGGVPAALANVASGAYPFTQPMNLVTRQPPQGLAAELIEYSRSPEMRELVKKFGFVPAGEGGPRK